MKIEQPEIAWAKAYLNGIISRWKWVEIYQMQLERLQEQLITYGGGGLGEKVQSSPMGDALEKRVIKFVSDVTELKLKFYDQLDAANERQKEASARIMCLKVGKCQDILLDHYVRQISFTDLANAYGYDSELSIYKLHERAIRYFAEVAKENGWIY